MIVRVEDLTYRYPENEEESLKGISFEIAPGELFLLAGETGSGKSTLLSVLCGLIPTEAGGKFSGRVEVLGKRWPVSPQALYPQVAVVFQSPAEQLLAEKVFSEVAFGLENLGFPPQEIRRRVFQALQRVGLAGFEDREIARLSGGERQRVAIAAALAADPRVLLLDAPLAQLDPGAARSIMSLLKELSGQGVTIVLAEHRLEFALPFVDRVCYLERGKMKFLGPAADFCPPKKVFRKPPSVTSGKVVLQVQDLSFAYPGRPPLFEGLNLSFRAGERVAFLGANGSGKTTLLHLLAGFLKPLRGEIRLCLEAEPGKLPLALLLQDPDLMLIRERVTSELAFAPKNLGLPKNEIEKRVFTVAEGLSLLPLLSRVPFSLSRGQRLRVALGSLLTGEPRILLLDEPTTAQDTRNAVRLLEGLRAELVIFSTHDEDLAYALATRILRFENGNIREATR